MDPQFKMLTAEVVRMHARQEVCLPESLRSNLDISTYYNDVIGRMVIDMKTKFAAMMKEHIVVHRSWPADWWQAVKERFAPQWVKRWFPVKYERVDIDQKIYASCCPHLDIKFRDDVNHYHFQFMAGESCEDYSLDGSGQ